MTAGIPKTRASNRKDLTLDDLPFHPFTELNIRSRDPQQPFVVAYGGGLNSTAILVGLVKRDLRPDLITFADTGGEKPETYEHLEEIKRWLPKVGFPQLSVIRNLSPKAGYQSLEDECLRKGEFPSRVLGLGKCSMSWKIWPQEYQLKHWSPALRCWEAGLKVFKAIGYDGGELRRMKFVEDDYHLFWYPLIEWGLDRRGCEDLVKSVGLPIPVKSACFYCPSSTKTEVLELKEKHPDLFARALKLEANALAAGTTHSVAGLGRHWSWKALAEADEATRARMIEAPVEPCTRCADDTEE